MKQVIKYLRYIYELYGNLNYSQPNLYVTLRSDFKIVNLYNAVIQNIKSIPLRKLQYLRILKAYPWGNTFYRKILNDFDGWYE